LAQPRPASSCSPPRVRLQGHDRTVAFWGAAHWASSDGRRRGPAGPQRASTRAGYAQFAQAVAAARYFRARFVIPQPVGPAKPLVPSRDEQYLEQQYGESDPQGTTTLNSLPRHPLASRPTTTQGAVTAGARRRGVFGATVPLPRIDTFTPLERAQPPELTCGRSGGGSATHFVPSSPARPTARMVAAAYPAIKAVQAGLGGADRRGLSYTGSSQRAAAPVACRRCTSSASWRAWTAAPAPAQSRSGCAAFQTLPADGFAIQPVTRCA